jgi:ArsR family transcriptional regulator, virulence genes transcriptional regulator
MNADVPEITSDPLESRAAEVAAMLDAMANPKRLLVLCSLLAGERSAGELAQIVDLSAAALSQHLGKMRALRLVATRRDGQTIHYRLASAEVRAVLDTLYRVYCAPENPG